MSLSISEYVNVATVGSFIVGIISALIPIIIYWHDLKKTRITKQTWKEIWSSEASLKTKISLARGGVPLDLFDLLYINTHVEIILLKDGNAKIKWTNEVINWGDGPIEGDSIIIEFADKAELRNDTIKARVVKQSNTKDKRDTTMTPLLISNLGIHQYRYKIPFSSPLLKDRAIKYEMEYLVDNIFPKKDEWWTQYVFRVTNALEIDVILVSDNLRFTQANCKDLTPGGAEIIDQCSLKYESVTNEEGKEVHVSKIHFSKAFPSLGHSYRLSWSTGDIKE